jgi:chromosome segregation ATPase
MRSIVCAAFAAAQVQAINLEVHAHSSLTFDEEAAKNRPVTKVVNLLKDMLKQLEKEAEEDEEIYDQLACWCETNDKGKTKSIADAETRIKDLTVQIEELSAASARLNAEIKGLDKEVAENQAALDSATALREKELAEFNAEEKDLLLSIDALKNAIQVLSKHNSAAFLQLDGANMQGVAYTLQYQLARHQSILEGVLTHSQKRAATAFIQAPQDYFDAEPTFKQSYAPQSGEIFGILNQMKESFEQNLAETQKDEAANVKAYEQLKAAKEDEIVAGQEQAETKTQELADTDEKLAQSKEDLDDTRASLSEDEAFLMMLKEKCASTDAEWEERQKTRQLEMEACSKALAVLSSDEAHDLFTKTFNPAFIQEEESNQRRTAAAKVLKTAALKNKSPRLAAIAIKVQLDAFVRVKKAIDDMITQLTAEKKDEIKHKDFCVEEFNTNQLQTERKDREKEDLLALIEDLDLTIKTLSAEIDTLKSEIAELNTELKRAGEDREKQNKEFQQVVADQRASQKLLTAALDILKGFYEKEEAALLQQKDNKGPPPPPGFKEYKKSGAAGGVMGMIQEIINDAKKMEADATRAEAEAQAAYEDLVNDTNASIEEKTKSQVNKTEEKAKAEENLQQAITDKEAALLELEELSNYNAELHQNCDFIMKNFEIRQTARDEEIEALRQAKSILSGAKFIQYLQTA